MVKKFLRMVVVELSNAELKIDYDLERFLNKGFGARHGLRTRSFSLARLINT